MTDWTTKDTEALSKRRNCESCIGNPMVRECSCTGPRAAAELDRRGAEIERLAARVAELEGNPTHLSPALFAEYGRLDAVWVDMVQTVERLRADLTNSIPRDELVRALDLFRLAEWNDAPQGNERLWAMRAKVEAVLQKLTDAARAGAFPPKESMP